LDNRESDRFFLYVHYMDVHDYGNIAVGRYVKSVRSVDWAVGDLLAGLAERDLLEGATVILTSDHGERLGERHAIAGKSGHTGNPSFQEVLSVPLIIAPASQRDPAVFLRTQDLFALILELTGGVAEVDAELAADELYLSETDYRTYVRGRWKSAVRRSDDQILLFDLVGDPGERRDVAAEHPDVVARHRARIDELAERLSARLAVLERLSEDDRERLRALGYLDQLENPH
jgi:arylsulfatase A-like enzyme